MLSLVVLMIHKHLFQVQILNIASCTVAKPALQNFRKNIMFWLIFDKYRLSGLGSYFNCSFQAVGSNVRTVLSDVPVCYKIISIFIFGSYFAEWTEVFYTRAPEMTLLACLFVIMIAVDRCGQLGSHLVGLRAIQKLRSTSFFWMNRYMGSGDDRGLGKFSSLGECTNRSAGPGQVQSREVPDEDCPKLPARSQNWTDLMKSDRSPVCFFLTGTGGTVRNEPVLISTSSGIELNWF